MKIKIFIKSVYGSDLIYPACETGKNFCSLTGTKSFTSHAINICKKLGYEFEIVTPFSEI